MKKLYSTIMLLAMMVAALSLTACGGDDEDGDNGGGGGSGSSSSSTFTILYTYPNGNEETYTYENEYEIKALGAELENLKLFERTSGSYFSIMFPRGNLYIVFPSSKYGKDLDSSYFTLGFSDFGEDATVIVLIDPYAAGWYGEYLSGSAKVVKNDGKYVTITFNDNEVVISRSEKQRNIKLNGTISFENKVK